MWATIIVTLFPQTVSLAKTPNRESRLQSKQTPGTALTCHIYRQTVGKGQWPTLVQVEGSQYVARIHKWHMLSNIPVVRVRLNSKRFVCLFVSFFLYLFLSFFATEREGGGRERNQLQCANYFQFMTLIVDLDVSFHNSKMGKE
jgi:hypothetical protein